MSKILEFLLKSRVKLGPFEANGSGAIFFFLIAAGVAYQATPRVLAAIEQRVSAQVVNDLIISDTEITKLRPGN
ncbi:hypothetical protein [Rhodobacter capsulatus]|uniref:hypothetical protein n=1 Tax=Rhodobacter capsulatus TaxID=1061 RepID=UPI00103D2F34|nr:hypothetical protein [Rhodobacter capsulatus]